MKLKTAIGGLKRCRISKKIRIYDANIRDNIMETYAALHNFRLLFRDNYKINELLLKL